MWTASPAQGAQAFSVSMPCPQEENLWGLQRDWEGNDRATPAGHKMPRESGGRNVEGRKHESAHVLEGQLTGGGTRRAVRSQTLDSDPGSVTGCTLPVPQFPHLKNGDNIVSTSGAADRVKEDRACEVSCSAHTKHSAGIRHSCGRWMHAAGSRKRGSVSRSECVWVCV